MMDSADIDDKHRAQILEAINNADAKRIIVCHGTNTMTKSAEYIAAKIKDKNKTVILTGAMIPLKEFAMSDAGFNLGFAMSEALRLDAGVYVCMHAQTFKAGAVQKNVAQARFEAA
jgi:L-asparaginase